MHTFCICIFVLVMFHICKHVRMPLAVWSRAGLTILPVVPCELPRQGPPTNCQFFTTLFWRLNVEQTFGVGQDVRTTKSSSTFSAKQSAPPEKSWLCVWEKAPHLTLVCCPRTVNPAPDTPKWVDVWVVCVTGSCAVHAGLQRRWERLKQLRKVQRRGYRSRTNQWIRALVRRLLTLSERWRRLRHFKSGGTNISLTFILVHPQGTWKQIT